MARSQERQRQQNTPQGAFGWKEAVKPQGSSQGPSLSSAQPEQASSGTSLVGLLEQMLERGNMLQALQRVEANGGAPGVDGMGTKRTATAFDRENAPMTLYGKHDST